MPRLGFTGCSSTAITVWLLVASATPAAAQWFVSGYLGDASTASTTLDLRAPGVDAPALRIDDVSFDDESWHAPPYYGVRVERRFRQPSWLRVEIEFLHAKTISDSSQLVRMRGRLDGEPVDAVQPLGTVLPRFELSHGLNFLLGSVGAQWPLLRRRGEPLLDIVGRIGAGVTVPHVEADLASSRESADAYQWGRPALAAGLGAELRLTRRLSAFGELKVTRTRQRVAVGVTEIEGLFITQHLVAGLSWRLTGRP